MDAELDFDNLEDDGPDLEVFEASGQDRDRQLQKKMQTLKIRRSIEDWRDAKRMRDEIDYLV